MPNPEPQRKEHPAPLEPSLLRLQRTLTARAESLEEQSRETDGGNASYLFVAAEFRALAAELHH